MKPERLRELAERLAKAKAMPERFEFRVYNDGWTLTDPEYGIIGRPHGFPHGWWSLIGPLLDELAVAPYPADDGDGNPGTFKWRMPYEWLELCMVAVVEAAEAKR